MAAKESKEDREDREDREEAAAAKAGVKAARDAEEVRVGGSAPSGKAALRAELQNLRDRVDANQPDEITRSFAKINELIGDDKK